MSLKKKIGIALYLNYKKNKIKNLYKIVSNLVDFVHVDLVDITFNKAAKIKNNFANLELIQNLWNKKKIHIHVMSKNPTKYIYDIKKKVEIIFIHVEIKEKLKEVIRAAHKKSNYVGLAFKHKTNFSKYLKYIDLVDYFLVLAIDKPGTLGEVFNYSSLKKIDYLKKFKKKLCIDGGVNDEVSKALNVEYLVSGTYIMQNKKVEENIKKLRL
jgi:pentose-5-phosphate-3-epimerase